MKKLTILFLFILSIYSLNAQQKKYQLYSKNALGFYSGINQGNFILDNEISLYINTFGNTHDCGNDTSLGNCIFTNLILAFSSFEVSGGFDTILGKFDSPAIQPKFSVYIRPFHVAKIGASLGTKHPSFNFGFAIPVKNIMIEFLYKNVRDYNTDINTDEFDYDRFQLGIMIPLN
ncbi:hypothetical protein [Tenacibaculum sp. IB213877]|uniref:hypothetical protein n=1 Tax=Tenacibaculum sp. IB213877 TaxID=3097351 RepID=UPI002A5AAFAC|nr:hypothetical protein [Tenacibaculum sp. IB213877]MDY0780672.1 hypothetical protein [Tenacibaculum sp. IB213877]